MSAAAATSRAASLRGGALPTGRRSAQPRRNDTTRTTRPRRSAATVVTARLAKHMGDGDDYTEVRERPAAGKARAKEALTHLNSIVYPHSLVTARPAHGVLDTPQVLKSSAHGEPWSPNQLLGRTACRRPVHKCSHSALVPTQGVTTYHLAGRCSIWADKGGPAREGGATCVYGHTVALCATVRWT
jgi:hypothetical protein